MAIFSAVTGSAGSSGIAALCGVGSIFLCLAGTSGSSDFSASRSSSARQQLRKERKPPDFCFLSGRAISFCGTAGGLSRASSALAAWRADLLLLLLPCLLRLIRLRFEPRRGLGGSLGFSGFGGGCGIDGPGCCEVERGGTSRPCFSDVAAVSAPKGDGVSKGWTHQREHGSNTEPHAQEVRRYLLQAE